MRVLGVGLTLKLTASLNCAPQIQDISVETEDNKEKKSAKDALLLWCQMKTAGWVLRFLSWKFLIRLCADCDWLWVQGGGSRGGCRSSLSARWCHYSDMVRWIYDDFFFADILMSTSTTSPPAGGTGWPSTPSSTNTGRAQPAAGAAEGREKPGTRFSEWRNLTFDGNTGFCLIAFLKNRLKWFLEELSTKTNTPTPQQELVGAFTAASFRAH